MANRAFVTHKRLSDPVNPFPIRKRCNVNVQIILPLANPVLQRWIWILSMFIVNYGLSIELNTQSQANINDLKEVNVRRKGLLKNIDEQIALMIGVVFLIGRLTGIIPSAY